MHVLVISSLYNFILYQKIILVYTTVFNIENSVYSLYTSEFQVLSLSDYISNDMRDRYHCGKAYIV